MLLHFLEQDWLYRGAPRSMRYEVEGAIRCDANISIDEGKRVEIKNVGSFRELERALSDEITRQKSMSLRSIEIKGETRHWDDSRKVTKTSRTKEEEQDYRYLPEADIPTVILKGNSCYLTEGKNARTSL